MNSSNKKNAHQHTAVAAAKKKIKMTAPASEEAHDDAGPLLDTIRSLPSVMLRIYDFLPELDRVRLGAVDKQFYNDKEQRGRVVAVYGDGCWDLPQALEKIRELLESDGSPWGLQHEDVGNECPRNLPSCWRRAFPEEAEGDFFDQLLGTYHDYIAPHFDKTTGYDLQAIAAFRAENVPDDAPGLMKVNAPAMENSIPGIVKALEYINQYRERNQKVLREISEKAKQLGPFPPYNALYDLMNDYDNVDCGANKEERHRFLDAVLYAEYGGSPFADVDRAYEIYLSAQEPPIIYPDKFLDHLRPCRRFVAPSSSSASDGKQIQVEFKECLGCHVIQKYVRDHICLNSTCRHMHYLCFDCHVNHCDCRDAECEPCRPFFLLPEDFSGDSEEDSDGSDNMGESHAESARGDDKDDAEEEEDDDDE